MKKVLSLISVVALIACAEGKHVSAEEFIAQYRWVNQPQSMKSVSYLGQTGGRAFIRISSMSALTQKWSDQIIYIELSELPPAFRQSLPADAPKP